MLSSLFSGDTSTLEWRSLLICIAASLLLGILVAAIHMIRNVYTKNFVITLAVLPILVQSVIMLVNGNLGTGVAILGAFSLIRFRSVPGGSRDHQRLLVDGDRSGNWDGLRRLCRDFFHHRGALTLLYTVPFGDRQATSERELKVTIPEDLDYPQLFDDLFEKYTHSAKLTSVRTTTMGSLYELRYQLLLKDQAQEKQIIDEVRVRNGNLPVV